jgi:hypothetical protein
MDMPLIIDWITSGLTVFFTENRVFDVRRWLGPADTLHQGKEALIKFMNGRARAPEVFVKHMLC